MKLLLAFLLCLMTFFSAHAQQKQKHKQQHRRYLATKGERVEYDTAVVVNVSAYRDDIRLLKRKDLVIDSLRAELNSLYGEKNQQTIMANQQQSAANSSISPEPGRTEVSKKNKWYMNPIFGLGAGLLIGIYLIPDNTL